MKTRLFSLLVCLLCSPIQAQWKHAAKFVGPDHVDEYITCVYFLDQPGPPTIGYVGTGSRLYKTTDGGATWGPSWNPPSGRDYDLYWVTDISFKDSLLGWFSMAGDTDACYRTTDGGKSWKLVFSAPYGGSHVQFIPENNRVFVSLIDDQGPGMYASTNLGDTWKPVIDTGSIYGWAFSSASNGIASASMNSTCATCGRVDSNYGICYTSDSGSTWHFSHIPTPLQCLGFSAPLKTQKLGTYFLNTFGEFTVWRSDDFGLSWKKIYDMGPFTDSLYHSNNSLTPYDMGNIAGDLDRLYIQTDSGMFVSTDAGYTWKNQGSPSCITTNPNDKFYAARGVAFAGETHGEQVLDSGGLWKEVWPTAGVIEQQSNEDPCFEVLGPNANPSKPSAKELYVPVHCCISGEIISIQIFDNLGNAVGQATKFITDGQWWDNVSVASPSSAGIYHILVSVGSRSKVLNLSVY